jgi:hypothetical protein
LSRCVSSREPGVVLSIIDHKTGCLLEINAICALVLARNGCECILRQIDVEIFEQFHEYLSLDQTSLMLIYLLAGTHYFA